jgi:hypothetical protein
MPWLIWYLPSEKQCRSVEGSQLLHTWVLWSGVKLSALTLTHNTCFVSIIFLKNLTKYRLTFIHLPQQITQSQISSSTQPFQISCATRDSDPLQFLDHNHYSQIENSSHSIGKIILLVLISMACLIVYGSNFQMNLSQKSKDLRPLQRSNWFSSMKQRMMQKYNNSKQS